MRVIPIASVEGAITMPVPVVTVSGTAAGSPANVVDGNQATSWTSNTGSNFIQLDLGRIVKVYRLEVVFGATLSGGGSIDILSTDSPDDRGYGTFRGAYDRISPREGSGTVAGRNVYTFPAKPARYWRFNSPSQAEIQDIFVYAGSPAPATNARVRIGYTSSAGTNFITGGTIFSEDTNDLLDLDVSQNVDRAVWGGTLTLNNKAQKRSRSTFPEGTSVKVWIEGVGSLLGKVTNDDPAFSADSFTLDVEFRGEDEFLNQHMKQSYAGIRVSNVADTNDIISRGSNSILAQVTNSVGARVIGSTNVRDSIIGPNELIYYIVRPPTTKLQALTDLAEMTLDGAWVPQNTSFAASVSTYGSNLGRVAADGTTDGYWFGSITNSGILVSLRNTDVLSSPLNTPPRGILDVRGTTTSNGGVYDGNINRDATYEYGELFQNVLCPISACSVAGSFTWTTRGVAGGSPGNLTTFDVMVETYDKIGRIKRLHYMGLGYLGSTLPADTATDKYIEYSDGGGAVISRNLYTDYTGKFGGGATSYDPAQDVVTIIRARHLPFSTGAANLGTAYIDNFAISPVAHVRNPPSRYDFYVHESSAGSYSPDLFWFPRPRPGTITDGRHLADSHSLIWYVPPVSLVSLTSADANTIESFHLMSGDVYRVKNDVDITGSQSIQIPDGAMVNATSADYINRVASKSTHGSKQESIRIADMFSITSVGRRPHIEDVTVSDSSAIARETVKIVNNNRLAERRGTIVTRGNPNLQPGNVVQVKSDYTELAGYFYIMTANHKWNAEGYKTTLTVDDDRFRLSNEFARTQVGILSGTGRGLESQSGQMKTITVGKISASHDGMVAKFDSGGMVFPFNVVPDLSIVRHIRLVLTKYLPVKGFGAATIGNPLVPSFNPWTDNGLAGLGIDEESNTLTANDWLAQEFVTSSTHSVGYMLFEFYARKPSAASDYLLVGIFANGRSGIASDYDAPGTLISATDTDGLPSPSSPGNVGGGMNFFEAIFARPNPPPAEGWVAIPLDNIPTDSSGGLLNHGGQAGGGQNSNDRCFVEFRFNPPISPGKTHWLVFRMLTGTGSVFLGFDNSGGHALECQGSSTSGQQTALTPGWRSGKAGSVLNQFKLGNFLTARSNALSSAGGGNVPSAETGSGAFAIEPIFGDHFPFISPGNASQTLAVSEFPTSFVVRKDGFGDTLCSVGVQFRRSFTSSSFSPRRLDYQMSVDFVAQ